MATLTGEVRCLNGGRFPSSMGKLLSAGLMLVAMPPVATQHAPAASAGEYTDAQIENTLTYARDVSRHPSSVAQDTLGYLLSMGTAGERHEGEGGSWVYYEHARGLGVVIPTLFGKEAAIYGNFVFARDALPADSALYWHEYRHYQQSNTFGPLFLPAYVAGGVRGHDRNPFERDAEASGQQRAHDAAVVSGEPSSHAHQ